MMAIADYGTMKKLKRRMAWLSDFVLEELQQCRLPGPMIAMDQPALLIRIFCLIATCCFLGWTTTSHGQDQGTPSSVASPKDLSPVQVFELADAARGSGNPELAESAYRALATNPDEAIRNEARFRLALMIAEQQQRYREAAVLLRAILDEEPGVARVRLELARIQALLGNFAEARRELRAAHAAGLPPEVERLVRFFASTLDSRKRSGLNLDIAIAPDSNINRATRSETLETVIGNLDLSEDARQRSGIGLNLRVQAFMRPSIVQNLDWLAQVGATGRFYRENAFNDQSLVLQTGPQLRSGADRLSVLGIANWRWFGGEHYTSLYGLTGEYRHPLSNQSELRVEGSGAHITDEFNDVRSVSRFSIAAGIDTAFNSQTGGGARTSLAREQADDAAYSATSISGDTYLFREFGSTTAVLRAAYSYRKNDARVFLYPKIREDNRLELSAAGTFRALRLGSFAPLLRIQYEKNWSTVDIYDYKKLSAEIGITAAF